MRKIETQMIAAINGDRNWQKDNTAVVHLNDDKMTTEVYLHGSKIAEVDDCSLTIFDGGYQSKTTKQRLNALIDAFCNAMTDGVFQKDYQWFVRDNDQVMPFVNGYRFA